MRIQHTETINKQTTYKVNEAVLIHWLFFKENRFIHEKIGSKNTTRKIGSGNLIQQVVNGVYLHTHSVTLLHSERTAPLVILFPQSRQSPWPRTYVDLWRTPTRSRYRDRGRRRGAARS